MTEESVFAAAVAIPDAHTRAAFLDRACAGNVELRARLDALVAAHFAADPVLDVTAPAPVETATQSAGDRTHSRPSPVEVIGTVIAGRYKLRQPIGEGGMGTVWMADQTEPVRRKVAVKLIRAERGQSKTILARFDAERQAIALMDHPHIARLLDAGTTADGTPFFVMELVKGVPLTEFCDAHRLSIPDRLALFTQICSAVQHAHQKGVIHRDLKPGNILVESHDGKPVPKVIDFGLAKATSGLRLTEHTLFTGFGAVMGTPLYMAPEQAASNAVDVDTRADVYALGVILYELLTGTTPLTRESIKQAALDEMLKLIREQEAPTPSSRLSSSESKPTVAANRQTEPAKLGKFVRGELDWIVLKALAKDRDRRYETASGFARDVERFLNHEPVTAGPPTTGYRLHKFVQRNKGPVLAAALVAATLVAGVVGTTLGLLEARRQAGFARDEAGRKETARAEEARQRGIAEANEREAKAAKENAEKAAAKEKAANELTQKRLGQIEEGTKQFAGLLKGLDPRAEERGGDPLYVQLRRRAEKLADELDAEAVGDAATVAELQTILGNTLCELGSHRKAVAVLEKARATREAVLGPDRHETLTTLNNLGVAYRNSGRTREAIKLFEQIRESHLRVLGPDHVDTLTLLGNLARAYREAGQLPKATALYEQVRDAQVRLLEAEHPATLITLNNLAEVYQASGRLPEAIPLFERIRDVNTRTLGADHVDTRMAVVNLATAYRADRRPLEAIPLFEQALAGCVRALGPDHLATLTTRNNLALAYRSVNRVADAIAVHEQVRTALLRTVGPDHPLTLATLQNLAVAYMAAGRLPDAIPFLEQVRARKEATLEPDHPSTLTTVGSLAGAYQDVGRLPDALPLFEQAARGLEKLLFQHEHVDRFMPRAISAYEQAGQHADAERWRRKWLAVGERRVGVEHPAYAAELTALGVNLLRQQKWGDAEGAFRESLTTWEKIQPDTWNKFDTQSGLGAALLGQKKYADAEPLLVKGYEGLKERVKAIPPQGATRIPEALDRLIELYTATGKPDEVQKYKELRAAYREVLPVPRKE